MTGLQSIEEGESINIILDKIKISKEKYFTIYRIYDSNIVQR